MTLFALFFCAAAAAAGIGNDTAAGVSLPVMSLLPVFVAAHIYFCATYMSQYQV